MCFLWRQEKPGGFPFPSGRDRSPICWNPRACRLFRREPTEHILNELRESAQVFEAADCALHFLLESPEQEGDPTLQKTLPLLPKARLWQGDFQDTVPLLARRMFVDPEKLPLVILADRKGNGLYACSGYNVGTGKLLLRLLAELDK